MYHWFQRVGRLSALLMTGILMAGCELPPNTQQVNVVETIHGVQVADPYRWLENDADPQVRAWLAAQRRYTRSLLDADPHRPHLEKRLTQLLTYTQVSCPRVHQTRYLFYKREGDQNHGVIYARDGSHTAVPRPILDPNTWSADGTVALDWMQPTPDASLIAYGKSESGSEKSTLYVLDVATGRHLDDVIPNTRYSSIAWDPDCKGFLYTRYPEPGTVPAGDENYFKKLYYHRLGDNWRNDPLVLGDLRTKEEMLSVSLTSDRRYVMLGRTVDWAKNDLYIRPAGSGEPFRPIVEGQDGLTGGDTYGGMLYLRTSVGAPRYRIVRAPVDQPGPEYWTDVLPQQRGVIEDFSIIGGRLFVTISEDVHSRLLMYSLDGKLLKELDLPLPGSIGGVNGEPDGDEMFFSFQSFVYPPTNFRYQISTDTQEMLEQADVDADFTQFQTQQVWFTSRDGTQVPMFIISRKGLERNGDNPTLLYGYGGFDVSITPGFSTRQIPWLEAGGIYVVANIRGGGEFGQEWHEAGRLAKKQNVFDDFIAAAETLIRLGYTRPGKLAIMGGSNGGLLVGACLVQRPDLFQAVVCAVPLLDMIRYHHFAIARLWIPEYGSAEDAEQFRWLYAYSPYHHVREGVDYPSVLLTTGASDSRVQPMHAFKMTAALQQATSGKRPILLRVEDKAGHGQGMPLSKRIEETVDTWAFLMTQLGVPAK